MNDLLKMQESVRNYEANQWNITADDGIKLLNNIRIDQQTCLAYHTAGNKSILTTFFSSSLSKEFHSCVSWCEKQLVLIGIHFPQHWYHLFALPSSNLTTPVEHSLVPPVSKT